MTRCPLPAARVFQVGLNRYELLADFRDLRERLGQVAVAHSDLKLAGLPDPAAATRAEVFSLDLSLEYVETGLSLAVVPLPGLTSTAAGLVAHRPEATSWK
jgi:hypothetical protein